ncbi:MAG: CarD family transcriptional regulator [Armatimonadota bacterium]|nr:CarD family transcriptional regulator [Armatimonadota bacterium]
MGAKQLSSSDIEGDPTELIYEVGDKVVYPHHGAGAVINKEKRNVLGLKREYLTIQILHNGMTVMVPVDSANEAGLRKVIGKTDVRDVIEILRQEETDMPKNWNHRLKYNREKLKNGAILEVADVVRNLSLRELGTRLSVGDKQMFDRAKKILASELMYARGLDEKGADKFLDGLLKEIGPVAAANKMDDAT